MKILYTIYLNTIHTSNFIKDLNIIIRPFITYKLKFVWLCNVKIFIRKININAKKYCCSIVHMILYSKKQIINSCIKVKVFLFTKEKQSVLSTKNLILHR